MKVQQLFLRDVLSVKSLDLDFRDPVTGKPLSRVVLAGANGSGKTTILESLFGLLSAVARYSDGRIDWHSLRQTTRLALTATARMLLRCEVKFPGGKTKGLLVALGEHGLVVDDFSISEQAIAEHGTTQEIDMLVLQTTRLSGIPAVVEELSRWIQKASEPEGDAVGSVLYFPHDRNLPAVPQGELGLEPKHYQWAYRYKASGEWKGSTESYLFSLNYLDLEDRDRKTPANRFEQAIELVNSVLDGKRIARIEKGRVVVETADGQTHGLGGLSSGEKQLVLLLIEINRRIVPGSVILIDEPEISLHPTWQRGLIAALDKIIEQYDAQVILATHSLEIATSVMPHEVINLSDLDELPRGEWKPEAELAA